MSFKHIVSEGQDIFDVTLQRFGDVENLFDMLDDNENFTLNSALNSKDEIIIDNVDLGEVTIKEFYRRRDIPVVNADLQTFGGLAGLGDYNNDYNDDYDT